MSRMTEHNLRNSVDIADDNKFSLYQVKLCKYAPDLAH